MFVMNINNIEDLLYLVYEDMLIKLAHDEILNGYIGMN